MRHLSATLDFIKIPSVCFGADVPTMIYHLWKKYVKCYIHDLLMCELITWITKYRRLSHWCILILWFSFSLFFIFRLKDSSVVRRNWQFPQVTDLKMWLCCKSHATEKVHTNIPHTTVITTLLFVCTCLKLYLYLVQWCFLEYVVWGSLVMNHFNLRLNNTFLSNNVRNLFNRAFFYAAEIIFEYVTYKHMNSM